MVEAMSQELVAIIPESMGPYLAPITAVISMPLTFFMSNDAFYFGVLPVLSEAAGHYGITPVEMARASIVGQPVHLLSHWFHRLTYSVDWLELTSVNTKNLPSNGR